MPCNIIKISKLDQTEREKIYGASRISLCQKTQGVPGMNYLLRERGIDLDTIAQFRLGFVPFEISHPFSGRIVFPIFDMRDRLIALSVRPILDEDIKVQKYWNESFFKGENLYGLNIAKYHIAKWDFAIVVEGQVDVLKMHSHGFSNTVGILGSALTPWHTQLLKMWTRNFVFVPDGDQGGQRFADRAMEILSIYKEVNKGAVSSRIKHVFVKLPSEHDPASFLQDHGGHDLRTAIAEAMQIAKMAVPKPWR